MLLKDIMGAEKVDIFFNTLNTKLLEIYNESEAKNYQKVIDLISSTIEYLKTNNAYFKKCVLDNITNDDDKKEFIKRLENYENKVLTLLEKSSITASLKILGKDNILKND